MFPAAMTNEPDLCHYVTIMAKVDKSVASDLHGVADRDGDNVEDLSGLCVKLGLERLLFLRNINE